MPCLYFHWLHSQGELQDPSVCHLKSGQTLKHSCFFIFAMQSCSWVRILIRQLVSAFSLNESRTFTDLSLEASSVPREPAGDGCFVSANYCVTLEASSHVSHYCIVRGAHHVCGFLLFHVRSTAIDINRLYLKANLNTYSSSLKASCLPSPRHTVLVSCKSKLNDSANHPEKICGGLHVSNPRPKILFLKLVLISFPVQRPVDRTEHAFKDRAKDILVKPFKLLAMEPILQAVTVYMCVGQVEVKPLNSRVAKQVSIPIQVFRLWMVSYLRALRISSGI